MFGLGGFGGLWLYLVLVRVVVAGRGGFAMVVVFLGELGVGICVWV